MYLLFNIDARKDGCLASNVILTDPKFLIPWRYINRKTKSIIWKIIHQTHDLSNPENETIVVNIYRDPDLNKYIAMAKSLARHSVGSKLIEAFLALIHHVMGSYGLPNGATASDADSHLVSLMKSQHHNFIPLGAIKIGLCRHKALLFKILCDSVGFDCALVTGYSTGGRHQWNIITLDGESYIIDPTSAHFTWTKQGSLRTRAYRVSLETSFGHGGLTQKIHGIL